MTKFFQEIGGGKDDDRRKAKKPRRQASPARTRGQEKRRKASTVFMAIEDGDLGTAEWEVDLEMRIQLRTTVRVRALSADAARLRATLEDTLPHQWTGEASRYMVTTAARRVPS